MSLATLERTRAAWIAADDAGVLDRIRDEQVQLAVWQRRRLRLVDWLDTIDFDEIDDVQETLDVELLAATLPAILVDAGYPEGDDMAALATEIIALARRFARIMGTQAVRMRLEIIETDACRKFHMDHVTARLLMPLTDPGTQWIEAGAGTDGPIRHLKAGSVGLFKGRIWAETPAILHRSPPIAGTGVSRLLLVLDLPQPALTATNMEAMPA